MVGAASFSGQWLLHSPPFRLFLKPFFRFSLFWAFGGCMFIEIVKEDCSVESRNVNTKKGPMTFYHQRAYLHLPGQAYPSLFRVPVNAPADAYQPGRYTLSPGAYRINPYGDLEINRFDFSMVPAERG